MNINPVHFQYNGLGGYADDGKQHVGVLAQEVEQVAPYSAPKRDVNWRSSHSLMRTERH